MMGRRKRRRKRRKRRKRRRERKRKRRRSRSQLTTGQDFIFAFLVSMNLDCSKGKPV